MKNILYLPFLLFFIYNIIYSKDLEQAIELINKSKFDDAIEILETNGEENDILLAIAYLGKKDFKTAKVFALEYWLKNENDILANYILALISEELKEYDVALMYWEVVSKNAKSSSLKQLSKKHIEVLNKLKR
ncbi:MAG: hypothetical protein RMJ67_01460 [Elusimicrobiota bacterium]|nr:hypothetical protein [Endomicrobiia bacterium]MDW8165171.1 hypothetical protein [Elusimicrobiota bacterium]